MKNNWKRVVKAIRKNIDRKPFIKKDKGTSDKNTNMPVTMKSMRLVIGLLAQKMMIINKIIAISLLRGSRR